MPTTLAEELRRLRLMKGVSLRQIEKDVGISNAYLSQLETGKTDKPSPHVLHKLAEYYGAPYTYLMELAGYLQRQQSVKSKQTVGEVNAALKSAKLNPKEEELVVKFIELLRSQRGTQNI